MFSKLAFHFWHFSFHCTADSIDIIGVLISIKQLNNFLKKILFRLSEVKSIYAPGINP